ncbi:hypothetical protein BPAE_0024g00790 [Botrytis paeoniae]|uniref:Uncharacterized protein n=1 Tax=Botrytis paeoniae TaxID=278948 RepID=A0A4Z1G439_9HELO|nr:hypothetical protein BPAE_0024g00790 [Botrytis paeoniae]
MTVNEQVVGTETLTVSSPVPFICATGAPRALPHLASKRNFASTPRVFDGIQRVEDGRCRYDAF